MAHRNNEGNESWTEIKSLGTKPATPPPLPPTHTPTQHVGHSGWGKDASRQAPLPPKPHPTKCLALLLFTLPAFSKSIEG